MKLDNFFSLLPVFSPSSADDDLSLGVVDLGGVVMILIEDVALFSWLGCVECVI